MIDAEAFLRTIREQPDEGVHRLVYADSSLKRHPKVRSQRRGTAGGAGAES